MSITALYTFFLLFCFSQISIFVEVQLVLLLILRHFNFNWELWKTKIGNMIKWLIQDLLREKGLLQFPPNLVESPSVPPPLWFRRPCLLYAVVLIFRSLLTLRFHYKCCIFAHSTQSLIHTLTCTPIRLCRVWMKLLISYIERVLTLIQTKKHMYR